MERVRVFSAESCSMNVHIGCNTLYPDGRLTSEEQFTLAHQLRALETIAEAGFHAVEYSHTAHLPPADLEQIAAHTASIGLIPWSLHAWTPLAADSTQIEPVLKKYRQVAQNAQILDLRVVVAHSGGKREPSNLEARRQANTETLQALAEMLGPHRVVAVENTGPRADWQFVIEMVAHCTAPNVGLNIDTGHAHLHGIGVVEAILMAGSRLRTTHLQDNFGQRDDHLPPGAGQIDWPAALAALRVVGYQGVYMVEISDCPPGRDPNARADTHTAAQNLRRWLETIE